MQLPKLWAGFRGVDVENITGDGPELDAYCHRTGKSPSQSLQDIRREYFSLALYPLAWVSHHWEHAAAIFADLHRFPRRQVFPLHCPPSDLVGFQDAAEFNFYDSRFRAAFKKRPRHRREPVLAAG